MYVDAKSLNWGTTAVAVLITVLTLLFFILHQKKNSRGLPPGPAGWPFFGLSPVLEDKTCHRTLQKLQRHYGDFYSFRFCGTLYIHLGSMKAIRELHIHKAEYFEKCTDFSVLNMVFSDGVGVINGEAWRVLRKFTLQHFRETGMATISSQVTGPIYDSINATIDYLKSNEGRPIDMIQLLTDKCNDIFRGCMFSNSGISEQEVRDINKSFGYVMAFMTLTNLLYTGTISRCFLLPLKPGYGDARKHLGLMEKILEKVVDDHREKRRQENSNDFISAYFKEKGDRESRKDPTAQYFTDSALVSTLLQFVGDGVLSVAFFICLFLKKVLEHDDIQEKIYEELMTIVGPERYPNLKDKIRMQYTNSVILEIIRTTEYFAVFPSAQCIKETTIRGYRIPRGAIALMNVWASHHDPEVYHQPEEFDEKRFSKGERPELPIRFGVGKRNCIGESFTMAQVFLFLTSIIQKFKLTVPKTSSNGVLDLMKNGQMDICVHSRDKNIAQRKPNFLNHSSEVF